MADSVKLKVLDGDRRGEVFEVRAGHDLTFGNSADAGVRMEVPGLSRVHFRIGWDGQTCALYDLNSRNGVLLNGQRIASVVVYAGDVIEAGDLRLAVDISPARRRVVEVPLTEPQVETDAAPLQEEPEQGDSPSLMPTPVYEHVEPTLEAHQAVSEQDPLVSALLAECLADREARTYAVVDGAQAFELAFAGRLMGHKLYTLFSGALAVDLAHVGPCLVELTNDPSGFLAKWVAARGTNAGVLIRTRADLATLYAHLRHLFIATDEEHQEYFFRFYDPRVLRAYLPTCTKAERTEFFGPLAWFIVEDEQGAGLVRHRMDDESRLPGGRPESASGTPGIASV